MESHAAGLILANRAYYDHESPPAGETGVVSASGGLLEAVRPVIAPWDGERGTTWIGAGRGAHDAAWTDAAGYETIPTERGPLRHRRLYFEDGQWHAHYADVANGFLWPLLHLVRLPLPDVTAYYPRPARLRAEAWAAHVSINGAFADAAVAEDSGSSAWVHDYQLGLVPSALRERGYQRPIGFFLHTRFPRLDLVRRYLDAEGLVHYTEWVDGILGSDLAGFQVPADVEAFRETAVQLCGAERAEGGVRYQGRTVRTDAYPVGIDTAALQRTAATASLPESAQEAFATGLPVVVGLERADYTKGIPERLLAVQQAIEAGARFAYVGVASPTRSGVEGYDALPAVIAERTTAASAVAEEAGLPFIQREQRLDWPEVVALQRESAVLFTSSLADGMNLVPLQAVMAQAAMPVAQRGVMLVGRDAGAAETYADFEADGLVPVDPLDPEGMVAALRAAIEGRPGRVSDRLVEAVRAHDASGWGERFLSDMDEAAC